MSSTAANAPSSNLSSDVSLAPTNRYEPAHASIMADVVGVE